jgi:hypothetical protein
VIVSSQGCQMVYFHTKNPDLGIFWWALECEMLVCFTTIWNSILTFVLYFMVIWYIFPFWYVRLKKIWQPCSGPGPYRPADLPISLQTLKMKKSLFEIKFVLNQHMRNIIEYFRPRVQRILVESSFEFFVLPLNIARTEYNKLICCQNVNNI